MVMKFEILEFLTILTTKLDFLSDLDSRAEMVKW